MAVRPIDANAMLNELRPVGFEAEHSAVLLSDVSKMMREWVDRQPTLTQPNEWVSVEDRLPTDERPVLVFVGYADTMTGFITTSSYFCFDENPHWQWDGLVRDEQRTLFWMPLPAPPDSRPPEGEEDT